VLRAFTPEHPDLPLADIARTAGLDKATTRRLLLTLIEEGLVRQNPLGQRYALTLGILPLAAAVPTGGLREEARPVMLALARDCGVTVFLSIADPPGALCLERIHGTDPVHVRWWGVGQHMPWNRGAAPRLLLAQMPAEQARAALARAQATTPLPGLAVEAVLALLPEVRAEGWAVATDDVAVGLSAVAVPVRDAAGTIVAALSLGGLTHLVLGENGASTALERLRAAAAEISQHLI
jgi:DNA-binding IclR family transcriptional regulator